jgi:hypothetical protein|eukprot:scaffold2986_cov222-Alexandrium_tamarense.AAC.2
MSVIELFRRRRGTKRRMKILEGQFINLLGVMRRGTTSWIYFSRDDWRSISRSVWRMSISRTADPNDEYTAM